MGLLCIHDAMLGDGEGCISFRAVGAVVYLAVVGERKAWGEVASTRSAQPYQMRCSPLPFRKYRRVVDA